jgi:hypothetical protein
MIITSLLYWPGLSGTWLFDDYPNIVDNDGIHVTSTSVSDLLNAALSSPASDFKRPLASLSFAINYLVTGANAPAMKLTNLCIHLFNGLAAFLFLRALIRASHGQGPRVAAGDRQAALVVTAWLVLPINLTSVLYVVQRMESMANLAVLLGLWGYVAGRQRMLAGMRLGFVHATASILVGTAIGILAKETAIMLPLYAALIEIFIFRGRRVCGDGDESRTDKRVIYFFTFFLILPMFAGIAWLAPGLLTPSTWTTRDFTLSTRLLSEARIIVDYISWTIVPRPNALSFYHDDFVISQGIFSPPSTAACLAGIVALLAFCWWLRNRAALAGLGIALFFGCHVLTGTVLPLELVYEHRNYFSSLALMLALASLTAAIPRDNIFGRRVATATLSLLALSWIAITGWTAIAWGDPLSLARELALRAPSSPRAQYELGRTYIIYSNYDPSSPFVPLAYGPLERASQLRGSSILPEQALIFMTSKMRLPVKEAWWTSIEAKLRTREATIQDESSLDSLSQCLRTEACHFPAQHLLDAFAAALSHDHRSPRLLAIYANFAYSVIHDIDLAYQVQSEVVEKAPSEPAYRVTLGRIAVQRGDFATADAQVTVLTGLNVGGRLTHEIESLEKLISDAKQTHCDHPERCK